MNTLRLCPLPEWLRRPNDRVHDLAFVRRQVSTPVPPDPIGPQRRPGGFRQRRTGAEGNHGLSHLGRRAGYSTRRIRSAGAAARPWPTTVGSDELALRVSLRSFKMPPNVSSSICRSAASRRNGAGSALIQAARVAKYPVATKSAACSASTPARSSPFSFARMMIGANARASGGSPRTSVEWIAAPITATVSTRVLSLILASSIMYSTRTWRTSRSSCGPVSTALNARRRRRALHSSRNATLRW